MPFRCPIAFWKLIEKIQATLKLNERDMAMLFSLSESKYATAKNQKEPLDALTVMKLAQNLHIDYDSIMLGNVNFENLSHCLASSRKPKNNL